MSAQYLINKEPQVPLKKTKGLWRSEKKSWFYDIFENLKIDSVQKLEKIKTRKK